MPSDENRLHDPHDAIVVPYDRFLERRAWRDKVAADLRALAGTPSIGDPEMPQEGGCRTEPPGDSTTAAKRILNWNTSSRGRVGPH
jgi:hypothetical protein